MRQITGVKTHHENIASEKHGLQYLRQDQSPVPDDAGSACSKRRGRTD